MQNKNEDGDFLTDSTGSPQADASENASISQAAEENVTLAKSKLVLIKRVLTNIKEANQQLADLLGSLISPEDEARISISQAADESFKSVHQAGDNKVIEGVFDGECMIGPDGKEYSVPANYASKSKLIEGDILKLTITPNGTFIYKQIGPIERERLVGRLKRHGENEFTVSVDDKSWRVLNASVTYFKGADGDETVILVPKNGESKWAAVENIISQRF
jgi:hypothetical protein